MSENNLDNIFTDFDDSIFSDGSIDPMGLRIIWTSIGSKIFHNKLNTISTDIKLYTLNLFHHYIIYTCMIHDVDGFNKTIRKKPYYNKIDLIEGIVIFLENLLINATYNKGDSSLVVPGINKLQNLKNNEKRKGEVEKISIDRKAGILIRQDLLGIHGRHKGPFLQMGIFNSTFEDIYNNTEVWEEATKIFNSSPWKEAADILLNLLSTKVFATSPKNGKHFEYNVKEILTTEIAEKYVSLLNRKNFLNDSIKLFWLNRLGLKSSTAGILYKYYLQQSKGQLDCQSILLTAMNESNDQLLIAISAIEPFLTLIDKCMNRILSSKSQFDDDLILFITDWISNNDVDLTIIKNCLTLNYINQESISRLEKLISIYTNAIESQKPAETFIIQIIKYHQEIMKSRGNLNWVSIGIDNKLSVHKFSDQGIEYLKSRKWVNTYYIPTVDSLHKGLTYETT